MGQCCWANTAWPMLAGGHLKTNQVTWTIGGPLRGPRAWDLVASLSRPCLPSLSRVAVPLVSLCNPKTSWSNTNHSGPPHCCYWSVSETSDCFLSIIFQLYFLLIFPIFISAVNDNCDYSTVLIGGITLRTTFKHF